MNLEFEDDLVGILWGYSAIYAAALTGLRGMHDAANKQQCFIVGRHSFIWGANSVSSVHECAILWSSFRRHLAGTSSDFFFALDRLSSGLCPDCLA